MQRIIVSLTNDLTTDQRVNKVCCTLMDMDYEILLIGRKLPNSSAINREYKTVRMKLLFNKGFLFYAEYNTRLFLKLLFTKKDILLSNDLDTLFPNYLISRIFNKKLIYDSHELFTEIPELVGRPRTKSVWKAIEKRILPKLKNNYTVSNSIANYYRKTYNVDFEIIRNVPYKNDSISESEFPFDISDRKIIIYQGAVNLSRGIELMIEAMQYIENTLFIIIGSGDLDKEMKQKVNQLKLANKVKFLGKIPPNKLKKLTSLADIGISLEEDHGLNYKYSLPNKLFDYIQAKIPVLISDLPEMKKIIEEYKVGEVFYNRSPLNLAKKITEMLNQGKENYKNSLNCAADELVWENESVKLKNIFKNLK